MKITAEQILKILPNAHPATIETLMPFFDSYLPLFGIDTPQRLGGYFSQTGEESASFHTFKEYASGTEYEGRADLGNIEPGDGVKFKGRGPIQITGHAEYKACSLALFADSRLLDHPELLEAPDAGIKSSCWFWSKYKNLNAICDQAEEWHKPGVHDYTKFQWLTILINGGLNGFDVRQANYTRARQILGF